MPQKRPTNKSKNSHVLTGVAGEYYVSAELSRRGYVASITLRNTKGIDILASNAEGTRQVAIQVKSNQYKSPNWLLSQKSENNYTRNFFYVFVTFGDDSEQPDYYIVPSKAVAKQISAKHKKWKATKRRDGKTHNDSSLRKFSDEDGKFKGKWKILGL
jgi:hypothetical protein